MQVAGNTTNTTERNGKLPGRRNAHVFLALNIKVNGILAGSDHKRRRKDLENVHRINNLLQRKDQDGAQVCHEELDSTKVAKVLLLAH